MKKKVSVITVNYNNLKGLKRTISSVLSQSFCDFEYIIVDGGSSDGSKEYIESKQEYINQWVSEKDHGVYNAMNKAIRMAQGEYCIFINSGDHFFSSQSLENAAKMLNGSDYYVGETIIIDYKLASLCLPPQNMSFRFIRDKVLQHQSTFTRTQLLKEHPYNENLKIVSDWAHFLENWYFKKCSYQAINTIVAVYYTDGISFTNGDLLKKERKEVFSELFGSTSKLPHIKETAEEKKERINDDFAFKLKKALKMKPVSRDWKILRTGFKFLWKDLSIKSK